MSWFYDELSNQPSDRIANYLDNIADNYPVKFVSNLPVDITVIQESNFSGTSRIAGSIKPKGTLLLPNDSVTDGDIFYFKGVINGGNQHVCMSHKITKRLGTVIIGNISSDVSTFKRDFSAGGDISSINLHNMLPWPVIVTDIDNQPIAFIQQNVDLGSSNHHGDLSTSPSVYYDNLNQGIDIGTQFNVYIRMGKSMNNVLYKTDVFLMSFIVHDNDVDHIFIGMVTPEVDRKNFTDINSDVSDYFGNYTGRAIYRLGDPNTRVIAKNQLGIGLDKNRNTMNHRNIRSTVPMARYMKLSGENVSKIM